MEIRCIITTETSDNTPSLGSAKDGKSTYSTQWDSHHTTGGENIFQRQRRWHQENLQCAKGPDYTNPATPRLKGGMDYPEDYWYQFGRDEENIDKGVQEYKQHMDNHGTHDDPASSDQNQYNADLQEYKQPMSQGGQRDKAASSDQNQWKETCINRIEELMKANSVGPVKIEKEYAYLYSTKDIACFCKTYLKTNYSHLVDNSLRTQQDRNRARRKNTLISLINKEYPTLLEK